MKGKVKNKQLYVGWKNKFNGKGIEGQIVTIIDEENHPVYGKRYKIPGFDDWFEENCFEWVV